MQSSAGSNSLRLRSLLWLAAIPLTALAVSIVLAFGFAMAPRSRDTVRPTIPQARFSTQAEHKTTTAPEATVPPPAGSPVSVQPQPLWTMLAPWAYIVDALALVGLAAVFIVRR